MGTPAHGPIIEHTPCLKQTKGGRRRDDFFASHLSLACLLGRDTVSSGSPGLSTGSHLGLRWSRQPMGGGSIIQSEIVVETACCRSVTQLFSPSEMNNLRCNSISSTCGSTDVRLPQA